ARQAEAEREKRAKIIHSEGELAASQTLKEAANTLSEEPIAVRLRYLQTLTEIGAANNTTVVFPIPMDLLDYLKDKNQG
ncbi:MAG TPA: slipin family protein, partial [Myxococcota bacterium]|nr:slipin family protein [Myxococcota bacterium]